MFYITHENGVSVATLAPEGKMMSPAYNSDDFSDAASFTDRATAYDIAQNFGPEWSVEEIG